MPPLAPLRLVNFGGNRAIQPAHFYTPASEAEVLEILAAHRGRRIRAIGRLHSWSDAPVGDDVVLDLRRLEAVVVEQRDGRPWVTLGAGCQIKTALAELQRQAGATLPALGLITEQTVVGAMATGTHGSGRSSLSHYLAEARIACYDPTTGEPTLRTIRSGPELLAARCALGTLGVVVSISLAGRSQYCIEEQLRACDGLDDVLAAEERYPLQQFFLLPWSWRLFAQQRRETDAPRSWLAPLYRLYWLTWLDVGFHLAVQGLAKVWRGRGASAFFYRRVMPLLAIRGWRVVDRSDAMLVMEHELFRHIEIEVFVRRAQLAAALDLVRELLTHCGGAAAALTPATRQRLLAAGLADELAAAAGAYVHHYPICVRKVLPDETLISMAAGDDEPWYALSFISYARPSQRAGFGRFALLLARSLARLHGGRPHWGKVCPLTAAELAPLYPRWDEFRRVAAQFDPDGVFRNDWTDELLGPVARRAPVE